MSHQTTKIRIMSRALWLAAQKIDALSNPQHPCPNPEHCCDPQYIIEGLIRQAETELDISYGVLTYEEEVAAMRKAAKEE